MSNSQKSLTQNNSFVRRHFGFSLIEMVVVITILVTLSTLGFVSMNGYSARARDSVRVTDMNHIYSQLNVIRTKLGELPLPDDYRVINWVGTTPTVYQGYAGQTVLSAIPFQGSGKDPKDGTYYTYTTNQTQSQAQLMGYFEEYDTTKLTHYRPFPQIFPVASAASNINYTRRKLGVIGKKLCILVETGTLAPVQNTSTGTLDIATAPVPYTMYCDNTTRATGTGTALSVAFATNSSAYKSIGATCGQNSSIYPSGSGAFLGATANDFCLTSNSTLSGGVNPVFPALGGSVSWICNSIMLGGASANCTATRSASPYYCATNPTYPNIGTLTTGVPTAVNQAWTHNAVPGNCTFNCTTNYTWNGTNACNINTYTVSGSFGVNANGATINGCGKTTTADASGNFSLPPADYNTACNNITATRTNYTCSTSVNGPASLTANFATVAGSCTANTQTFTCAAKPATGTLWNTVSSYTQTWNGSAWLPGNSTTAYNTTASTTTCNYKCDTNYTWNGSSCVANTQTFTCAAKPATGTLWNTVSSYTQTWNGSAWLPGNSTTAYNTTASTTTCNYKCDTNYTWNGSSCISAFPLATSVGGTITTSGNYRIHTFLTSGTFTPSGTGNVEYLVVAGGGGGSFFGGGGAGGFRTGTSAVTMGAINVIVGAGGAADTNGGDSTFASITSIGGGRNGYPGGSGGGGREGVTAATGPIGYGSIMYYYAGASGTSGQGYPGGTSTYFYGSDGDRLGGGGGGAGGPGIDVAYAVSNSGQGGIGLQSSISGIATYYAGGGGGFDDDAENSTSYPLYGGLGGGGHGGRSWTLTSDREPQNGAPNTGGGGGGGYKDDYVSFASGGSGIVIVRYLYQ